MKVSELEYRRVTLEEAGAAAKEIIARVENAQSIDDVLAARIDYLKLMTEFSTANSLAYMRYTINTAGREHLVVVEHERVDAEAPDRKSVV